jgi:uncharacterized protein YeeX (DUF496 family)
VGDREEGEWEEWTGRAYHIRRRLTATEEEVTGPVQDIRQLNEARRRIEDLLNAAPYIRRDAAYDEIEDVKGN